MAFGHKLNEFGAKLNEFRVHRMGKAHMRPLYPPIQPSMYQLKELGFDKTHIMYHIFSHAYLKKKPSTVAVFIVYSSYFICAYGNVTLDFG